MVYFEDGDLHTMAKNEKNSFVKFVSKVRDLPYVAILDRQPTTSACALSSDHDAEDVKTSRRK